MTLSIRVVRKIKVAMIVIVAILLAMSLSGIFMMSQVIFSRFSWNSSELFTKISHKFQYFRVNTQTGDRVSGTTSTNNEIEEEEVFYITEESNEQELVSNFGSKKEYECSGSCYCTLDDDSNERRAASHLFRSLSHIFLASTSIFAINLAKNHFSSECEDLLSSECPSPYITSILDDCNEVSFPNKEYHLEFPQRYLGKTTIFDCSGNCLPHIYRQEEPEYDQLLMKELLPPNPDDYDQLDILLLEDDHMEIAKEYGCDKLYLENEIWVCPEHINYSGEHARKFKGEWEFAEEIFIIHHLDAFCLRNSLTMLPTWKCMEPDIGDGKMCPDLFKDSDICKEKKCKELREFEIKRPLCVSHENIGQKRWMPRRHFYNPTVKCVVNQDRTEKYRNQFRSRQEIKDQKRKERFKRYELERDPEKEKSVRKEPHDEEEEEEEEEVKDEKELYPYDADPYPGHPLDSLGGLARFRDDWVEPEEDKKENNNNNDQNNEE